MSAPPPAQAPAHPSSGIGASAPDSPLAQSPSTARPVDGRALLRARQRLDRQAAGGAAAAAPWLHGEVARRMAERLALLKSPPQQVLDAWPDAGGSRPALRAALPKARVDGLAWDDGTPATTSPAWWSRDRWLPQSRLLAPQAVEAGRYHLVWSNMQMHHWADPSSLLSLWQRALAVEGVLMFSTLGPGSLRQLTRLYREQAWGPAMAELVDMHDIGDMLVAAGFDAPVMDQELLRLTWETPEQALQELRGLGANAHPQRHGGLRTLRWRAALMAGLAQAVRAGVPGRVELEFELVYGQAFKPAPRLPLSPETRVGLDDLRQQLNATRKHRRA